jgi:hypothetical protein
MRDKAPDSRTDVLSPAAMFVLGCFSWPLACSAAVGAADSCSLDYVVTQSASIFGFENATQRSQATPHAWAVFKKTIPYLQSVLVRRSDGDVLLIGWMQLPDDYSEFSQSQALQILRGIWKSSWEKPDAPKDGQYKEAPGTPLTMIGSFNYVDEGIPIRELFIDVLASRRCLLSMRVVGRHVPADDAEWNLFRQQFDEVRRHVETHEGPIAFSKSGKWFSNSAVSNTVLMIAMASVFAAVAAFCITRFYRVVPGRYSFVYSIAITAICALALSVTTVKSAASSRTFEGAPVLGVLVALHLHALIRRSPWSVLLALSFMIGLFVVEAIYMSIGWILVPTISTSLSLITGLAYLGIVLRNSLVAVNIPTTRG